MFEIGIFGVILLAVGYWVTLWMAGRREDVLHGQFVQAEPHTEPAPEVAGALPPPAKLPVNAAPPAKPSANVKPSANAEALESLLVSIKRELKNAAQM